MIDFASYSPAAKILALKLTGQVGPRTFQLLLAHFKTLDTIFSADQGELLALDGIGQKRSGAIVSADKNLEKAQAIIANLEAFDAQAVSFFDEQYPAPFKELNDPPPILYYKGRLPLPDEKRVAIIGSQNVSAEGIGDAVELSSKLSKAGVSIVGGLARGIDTAGHVGALKEDNPTYGVLPCGIDQVYPEENAAMAAEMAKNGGLISEYVPGMPVADGLLISRNRLIVGLSQAIIIGEISRESIGTLDAALCCHQLGKLLFMIVGATTHHHEKLLEYGAIPLTHINEYEIIIKSLV